MKVILIYGSENDKPFMQPARDYLEAENLDHEEEVLSAHRNLSELIEYLGKLEESGEKAVILADFDLRGERIGFQLFGDDFGGTTLALGNSLVLFAPRFELGHVGIAGDQRLAAGNQEVSAEPIIYLYDLAGRTQILNIFNQNYFHALSSTQ